MLVSKNTVTTSKQEESIGYLHSILPCSGDTSKNIWLFLKSMDTLSMQLCLVAEDRV